MSVFFKQHPRLGGDDQPLIVGQGAAQGAQTVAVQRGTHRVPVGIEDGRRAVPGLHHGGVIAVQIPPGRKVLKPLPGLRQQDHPRQRQREAVHVQKLDGVVQHLAVAAAIQNDGQHPSHFVAQNIRMHGFFPGLHPVMVAPDGVDFAIVQQHPLRMGLAPGREGVGGKAGMHQGHLRGIAHVLEIVVEGAQLADQHHALVHDGFAGQGADIGIRILLFKHPAQNIEPPVKIRAGGDGSGTIQKALPDAGHGAAGSGAQLGRMAGHVPPAKNSQSFRNGQLLKNAADVFHAHLIFRQEKHPHAVISGLT